MIAVSDTTPLNYLILTDSVDVLPRCSHGFMRRAAVIKELLHPRSPDVVRSWASRPPEWLTVEDPTHIDQSLGLGAGETAAIAPGRVAEGRLDPTG